MSTLDPQRPSVSHGFHAHSGWNFKRTEDDEVVVTLVDAQAQVTNRVLFSAETWASIVASVSARSETGGTYRAALDFHNGRT